jgi:hypothetical protein
LPSAYYEPVDDLLVFEALIAAGEKKPSIRKVVAELVELTIQAVADELPRIFPAADEETCWIVAYGVVSIYFNYASLTPLDPPRSHWTAARASARRLIETLGAVE